MKKSGKVALGGIFSALALLCMLLTALPSGTYALPALGGILLLPVCLEAGIKWGFASFAAVSVLSLLIAPSVEAKVLFVMFFGYYPILKTVFDGWYRPWMRWGAKLLLFNAAVVGAYVLMLQVFALDADTFELFGVNLPLVFLAAGNVVFLIYDAAMTGLIHLYWRDWHTRFARMFR